MRGVINKSGQVWIETVIYTLIGLTIIGLVLAAALPKIKQKKDKITIEQSINALGNINDKIYDVQQAQGNRRIVNLDIKRGTLTINMNDNTISWLIDSSYPYSEVGVPISIGVVNVTTTKENPWDVNLKLKYNVDLVYNGMSTGTKQLNPAPTPYTLIIENDGMNSNNTIVIDLSTG